MKKMLATLLALLLALGAAAALAEDGYTKDETVYANLDASGAPRAVYVINAFDAETGASVTDYGDYKSVRPTTTGETLSATGGEVALSLPEGRYYYQGELNGAALPWAFDIAYLLDGAPVTAAELAGATGKLTLTIRVLRGDEAYKDFFDHYLCQISFLLNARKCRNVQSDSASLAVVGANINVSFTHMQGGESAYTLTADVEDFEMGGITITAVKMNVAGVATDKIAGLTAQFAPLAASASALKTAGATLTGGVAQITEGMGAFASGVPFVTAASANIKTGIGGIHEGLAALVASGEQLKPAAEALAASEDANVKALAAAWLAQHEALAQLATAAASVNTNYGAFDTGVAAIAPSAATLSSSFGTLQSGLTGYVGGVDMLADALAAIPGEVEKQAGALMQDMTGSGYAARSFTSDKNAVRSVTFSIRTDAIAKPAAAQPTGEANEPLTFFEKLLGLFGL